MLQSRRHHVWSDHPDLPTSHPSAFPTNPPKGVSKTPGPSKKPLMGAQTGGKKVAMTTGLRGNGRVLSKENSLGLKEKSKGMEEIEPQRLFKEALLPPMTARRNALLLDKTNTSKKPLGSPSLAPTDGGTNLKSSLQQAAKTPGPKKTVRLAPQTPAAVPMSMKGKGKGKEVEEDEAFRTPAPGKRAKRPPVQLEATPVEMQLPSMEGEIQTAQGTLFEGGEVPDVEYGPPTAIEESPIDTCEEVIDLEATARLFKIDGPILISTWEGSVVDAILEEEKTTQWAPETIPALDAEEEVDYEVYIVPDPVVRRAAAPAALKPSTRPPFAAPRPRAPLNPTVRSIRGSVPVPKSTSTTKLAPTAAPLVLTQAQRRRRDAQHAIRDDVDRFRKGGFMEAVGDDEEFAKELEGFRLEL